MCLQRLKAGPKELAAPMGDDADVEAVGFGHGPPTGTQSWIDTHRRIGNSP